MKIKDWKPTIYTKKSDRLLPNTSYIYPGSYLVNYINAKWFEAHLKPNIGGKLLDLGCGNAPLFGYFYRFVKSWTTADWKNSVHTTNTIDINVDLGRRLPFPNNKFDSILLSEVLEHVPNPFLLFKEMTRILKKDGRIIVTTPFYYCLHESPYDFYRYTNFAFEHFAKLNKLSIRRMDVKSGLIEIVLDTLGTVIAPIPIIGRSIAVGIQKIGSIFYSSSLGVSIAKKTSKYFPLGYCCIFIK